MGNTSWMVPSFNSSPSRDLGCEGSGLLRPVYIYASAEIGYIRPRGSIYFGILVRRSRNGWERNARCLFPVVSFSGLYPSLREDASEGGLRLGFFYTVRISSCVMPYALLI